MLNLPESVFKDVVHINRLWMACVRHSVVTDKNDIDDFCEVARFQRCVQVFCKYIDVQQCLLRERLSDSSDFVERTDVDEA
jgi:hypothetical protein